MDAASIILDILKYAMPSVMVFIIVFLIMKQFFEFQLRKTNLDIRRMNQQAITPLRLQAYERAVLLLERINPSSLVMRMNNPKLSKRDLHQQMLLQIRNEFDHNLTQQIYMSRGAWEAVKKAKEETIKLINVAATRVEDTATAPEFSRAVLELSMELERIPTQGAIDLLKQEVRTLY